MKDILGFLFLLMPLILLGIWLWLTRLLWKTGRRFLASSYASRPVRLALVVLVGALWFGGSFWEAGGKKLYWDAKVRELCEKDGGVKVYETVELPAEMFDKWGMVNFYRPTQGENALGLEFLLSWNVSYLKTGNPSLYRSHTQIFRRSDDKLLGESVGYSRGGGDLPGPWQPSSYSCPETYGQVPLLKEIFTKK